MFSQYEPIILRSLAVIALAAAFLFVAIITFNSGILGGNGSSSSESVEVLDSASAAVPAESRVEPAATTPTTGTRTHVVADGDSFYSIARKYDVTISEIQQLNPNVDPQNLTSGLRITIP
ncbi:MAG: LysM peptidoglycan-binding domain-containing protein [Actinobacteria bacterium]|nr:LysM peptidoglycan-binding domain-containing protein [Actinomycetota bacterium]